MPYQPIENYGVIGDLHTVALVGMDGSIDFLCYPRFDSPTVFAALLGEENGGRFRIGPTWGEIRQKQLYLPDTNILLTRFLAEEGVAEISDYMPVGMEGTRGPEIVRRVKAVRGDIHFRMVCDPKFDYGRASHKVERRNGEVIFRSEGDDGTVLRLRSEVPLEISGGAAVATFLVKAGSSVSVILEDGSTESLSAADHHVSETFKTTMNYWHHWARKSRYRGRWREMVTRSALVLKLLTSARHGSIVAAPTFGLPEDLGGSRNWDYRYTWIRDASFTLYGLMRLGYTEEAAAFMKWIEERCQELGDGGTLQLMYALDGHRNLKEEVLGHLAGYRNSQPVRIGNGAYDQLQLDIYGELMDSVYLYNKYGKPISYDFWTNLSRLIEWIGANWHLPDEGIWEVRGGRKEFLNSRVMSWVAIDRGIRLAEKRSFPAPVARWRDIRDAIYRDVYENFWDEELQTFVQYRGAKIVDASALLMPLVRFIGSSDPRWLSTLRAIEDSLVEDSFVHRYNIGSAAADALPGSEGTFTICTFWYVECLSRAGDVDKARFYFEKALGYANHLGLYGEELGPRGEHLGNFPQAFTHLALISAAYELDRSLEGRD